MNLLLVMAAFRRRPARKVILQMPAGSGRLEKRIRVAVPVEITSLQYTSANERTTTENVCSLGIRVLTQNARELNERVMIQSLVGDLRTLARVVYCQRLPDGHFGVGLQFQGVAVNWSHNSLVRTADGTMHRE
jgi:hypothetical protein